MKYLPLSFLLASLLLAATASPARADATEPAGDIPGVADLPWLKRHEGSRIVSRAHSDYDQYLFPTGPLRPIADVEARDASNNRVFEFTPRETIEGARTRLVYLLPPGRSPLEAVRGYEQEILGMGGREAFECADAACSGDTKRASAGGGGDQSVAMKLWPAARITDPDFSNGACAQTAWIADQRLASFSEAPTAHRRRRAHPLIPCAVWPASPAFPAGDLPPDERVDP